MATKAELERALAEAQETIKRDKIALDSLVQEKENLRVDVMILKAQTERAETAKSEAHVELSAYVKRAVEAERIEKHARFESNQRGDAIKALCLERDDLKMANERLKRENTVLVAINEKQNRWIEQYVIVGKVPT